MKNYINQYLAGNERAFDAMYVAFRPRFFAWFSRKEHLSADEIKDLYQKAVLVLHQRIAQGRIGKDGMPDAAIGTFLIQTGDFLLRNQRRKRELPLVYPDDWGRVDAPDSPYDPEEEAKILAVRTAVRDMPMPCSQLMSLIVFSKKTHAEVARLMNYKSADVVKVTSGRCREKLREVIVQRLKMLGYEHR